MTDILPRYRAESADAMIVRALDDITLIYHRPSGQTHMVASPVPEILAALGASEAQGVEPSVPGPLPSQGYVVEDVLGMLARHYDLGDLGDLDEALPIIAAHLDEMAALGLVRRA